MRSWMFSMRLSDVFVAVAFAKDASLEEIAALFAAQTKKVAAITKVLIASCIIALCSITLLALSLTTGLHLHPVALFVGFVASLAFPLPVVHADRGARRYLRIISLAYFLKKDPTFLRMP